MDKYGGVYKEEKRLCKECGVASDHLKLCGQCQSVFYCSEACQRVDWKWGHKNGCVGMGGFLKAFKLAVLKEEVENWRKDSGFPRPSAKQLIKDFVKILRVWGSEEIRQIVQTAKAQDDHQMLIDFFRNSDKDQSARTTIAFMYPFLFEKNRDAYHYKGMPLYAFGNGFPIEYWNAAKRAFDQGDHIKYKWFIMVAAKGGIEEAKVRLDIFMANYPTVPDPFTPESFTWRPPTTSSPLRLKSKKCDTFTV